MVCLQGQVSLMTQGRVIVSIQCPTSSKYTHKSIFHAKVQAQAQTSEKTGKDPQNTPQTSLPNINDHAQLGNRYHSKVLPQNTPPTYPATPL